MKLNAFNPNVPRTTISNGAKVDAVGNLQSFGATDSDGWNTLAKGIMHVEGAIQTHVEEQNKIALINAQTDYQKQINDLLYNEKDGLAHTSLGGAANVSKTFLEKEKEIRSAVFGNLPNYEYMHRAFDEFATKSTIANHAQMENHEFAENEKYTDISVNNSKNEFFNTATLGYQSPAVVEMSIKGVTAVNGSIYGKKGEEYVNALNQKDIDKIATSAIQSAIANENPEAVDKLIPMLREHGASESILQDAQSKISNVKTTMEITKAVPTLYAKHGGNVDAALEEFINSHSGGSSLDIQTLDNALKKEMGKPYSIGADGVDATDCGKMTQDVMKACGIDLGDRTADGQYKYYENQNKISHDVSNAKKGDLVFWRVPANDQKWPDAYKHVTHVGIYVGDGMVTQAGVSNGVSNIPIDTYEVVGIGQNTTALTESQRYMLGEKFRRDYAAYDAQEKRKKAEALSNLTKAINAQLDAMALAGTSPMEQSAFLRKTIDQHPELLGTSISSRAISLEKSLKAGMSRGDSDNSFKVPKMHIDVFKQGIATGKITDYKDLENAIAMYEENYGGIIDYDTRAKLFDEMENKIKGKGDYSINMEGFKTQVKSIIGGKDSNFDRLWAGVKEMMPIRVKEFQTKNGRDPSYDEKLQLAVALCQEKELTAYTTPSWMPDFVYKGATLHYSEADLAARGYVDVSVQRGADGNNYYVFTRNDGTTETKNYTDAYSLLQD